MKIILGSAQFGMRYGINNHRGQPTDAELIALLCAFAVAGGHTIDTAYIYGNSEIRLGELMSHCPYSFKIISKFPKAPLTTFHSIFTESLHRLGLSMLEGYLFHDIQSFLATPHIWSHLQNIKEQGLVKKIGFSLYHPQEALALLDQKIEIDLLQIPYNVFDQRFESVLPELKKRNIEIHARSIFLQGLFFIPPHQLPPHFFGIRKKLQNLYALAQAENIPLHALLMNFVQAHPHIDQVVLGVDSIQDLHMNLQATTFLKQVSALQPTLRTYAEANENFILPYLWPQYACST